MRPGLPAVISEPPNKKLLIIINVPTNFKQKVTFNSFLEVVKNLAQIISDSHGINALKLVLYWSSVVFETCPIL